MTGTELAKELNNYVNVMARSDDDFVDTITRQHRTLQQQAFTLFMKCVKEWANADSFDERNAHTIQMCKKIMEIENINSTPYI